MKTTTKIIIGGLSAIVPIVLFLTRKKWLPLFTKKPNGEPGTEPSPKPGAEPGTEPGTKPSPKPDTPRPRPESTDSFPISFRARGANVKRMQEVLGRNKLLGRFHIDGILGHKTEEALRAFGYKLPISQSDFSNIDLGIRKTAIEIPGIFRINKPVWVKKGMGNINVYSVPSIKKEKIIVNIPEDGKPFAIYYRQVTGTGWSVIKRKILGRMIAGYVQTDQIWNVAP